MLALSYLYLPEIILCQTCNLPSKIVGLYSANYD